MYPITCGESLKSVEDETAGIEISMLLCGVLYVRHVFKLLLLFVFGCDVNYHECFLKHEILQFAPPPPLSVIGMQKYRIFSTMREILKKSCFSGKNISKPLSYSTKWCGKGLDKKIE